jgi:uncharacterized OsmC-like protein
MEMAEVMHLKVRQPAASASLGRTGDPTIRSAAGGELDMASGPFEPGFNVVELFYASVAAGLAMSARVAAGRLGVLADILEVTTHVHGERSGSDPARIERLHVRIDIKGDMEPDMRRNIVRQAEDMCLLSNTLLASTNVVVELQT